MNCSEEVYDVNLEWLYGDMTHILGYSVHYLHYARVSFLSKGGLYSVRVWTLSTVRMNCVNVDTGGVTLLCLSLRGHNRRSWTRLTSTSSPQKTRRMPNLWINLSSELVFLLWFLNTNPNPLSRHNHECCVTFCKNVNAQGEWREGRIHTASVFYCVADFSTSSPWSQTSLAECSASSSSPASLSACRP